MTDAVDDLNLRLNSLSPVDFQLLTTQLQLLYCSKALPMNMAKTAWPSRLRLEKSYVTSFSSLCLNVLYKRPNAMPRDVTKEGLPNPYLLLTIVQELDLGNSFVVEEHDVLLS